MGYVQSDFIREAGCAALNIVDHTIQALGYDQERRQNPSVSRRIIVIPGYLQKGNASYRSLQEKFRGGEADIIASNTRYQDDLNYSAQQVIDQIVGMNGNGEVIDGLIGHSMGGLIATKVAQTPGIRERIRNLICLATPFGGTPVAYLGILRASARQMLPRKYAFGLLTNRFLEELERGEYDPGTRVIHIYGTEDRIVPVKSAMSGRANEKVEFPLGHFSMLYDDCVHQLVRERVLGVQAKSPLTIL